MAKAIVSFNRKGQKGLKYHNQQTFKAKVEIENIKTIATQNKTNQRKHKIIKLS